MTDEFPDPHDLIRDIYLLLISDKVTSHIEEIEEKIICYAELSKNGFWLEDLEPLSRILIILTFYCENKANDGDYFLHNSYEINYDYTFRMILLRLLSIAHLPIRMHVPSEWINGFILVGRYLASLSSILTNEALLNDTKIEKEFTKGDTSLFDYKNITQFFKDRKDEDKLKINEGYDFNNKGIKKENFVKYGIEISKTFLQDLEQNNKCGVNHLPVNKQNQEKYVIEKVIKVETYDDDKIPDIYSEIGSIYSENVMKKKHKKKVNKQKGLNDDDYLLSSDSLNCSCDFSKKTSENEIDDFDWNSQDNIQLKLQEMEEEYHSNYSQDSFAIDWPPEKTDSECSFGTSIPLSSTLSYSKVNKEEIIPIQSEKIQILALKALYNLLIKKKIEKHKCCPFNKSENCYVTEDQALKAMDYGSCAARISDALTLLKNKVFIYCAKFATLLSQRSQSFAMTLIKRGNINTVLLRQYLFYTRGIPLEELPDDSFTLMEQFMAPSEERIQVSFEAGRLLWQLLSTVKNWKEKATKEEEIKDEKSFESHDRDYVSSKISLKTYECETSLSFQNSLKFNNKKEKSTEMKSRSLKSMSSESSTFDEYYQNTRGSIMPKMAFEKILDAETSYNCQDFCDILKSDEECIENGPESLNNLENFGYYPYVCESTSSFSIYDPTLLTKPKQILCTFCKCPLYTPMSDALDADPSFKESESILENNFESHWKHWLIHHDILGQVPNPTSAALQALRLHCKWMILIGDKIERNNILAQIIMILSLWKDLPISSGKLDYLLTSLCICEKSAEEANKHFVPDDTPIWSYQSPGSPVTTRIEDLQAKQLCLIGCTLLVKNHNTQYFHKKFQILQRVCKKMKPKKQNEQKTFCDNCGKLESNNDWDSTLVMIVCTTVMAHSMIDSYLEANGMRYLVQLIGFLRNVRDMERLKTILMNALHSLYILLEHFNENTSLKESAINAKGIDILLYIFNILISDKNRSLYTFCEKHIILYCVNSLTILIKRNETMLHKYAEEFLQISLTVLQKPSQISNDLIVCFFDLCWEGVIWNSMALDKFVDNCGAYLLLDSLDNMIYPIVTQILGLLVDMAFDGGCIPHLLTWRSKKTGLALYPTLLNIWRHAENIVNVERDEFGIIQNLEKPLVPTILENAVPFIRFARSKIYSLLEILENKHKEKVILCYETYRIGSSPLSVADEITLVLARNYLALSTAEHASMNLRATQEKSLLFKDNFLIQLIAKHFENDIKNVRNEQIEILDKLKAKEIHEEKTLYKKLQKALVPLFNKNKRFIDKLARTSDRTKMLEAKRIQRDEINKELSFPDSGGPDHCHRTYQEYFPPTVFSGKHFLLKSIKDVIHDEPPRPVSPISDEDFDKIFPEEIYNPLVKDGFIEYSFTKHEHP